MCYADKYDAMGEALHEILAGNHHFTTNLVNEYGRIPTPMEYYTNYFQAFAAKFPDLQPLLAQPFSMFEAVPSRDYALVVGRGRLHTPQSLHQTSSESHYDTWRQIVWDDTNDEVRQDLLVPKEFLHS